MAGPVGACRDPMREQDARAGVKAAAPAAEAISRLGRVRTRGSPSMLGEWGRVGSVQQVDIRRHMTLRALIILGILGGAGWYAYLKLVGSGDPGGGGGVTERVPQPVR